MHGNNRRLLDLSALSTAYDQEYYEALLSLHAFIHCGTTSAFVHIGKVKPIKILEKFPHFQQSLGELGESWDLNENATVDLEHFVCTMYRCVRYHDVNKLHYDMLWKNAS